MLIEKTLFGTVDKVQTALDRLKEYEPPEGYYVCFSGGKDSTVIYDLVKKSGVKYDVHYNITTIEPPELIDFVKTTYPEIEMIPPKNTMYDLIVKYGYPPLRKFRYCTRELKNDKGVARVKVTGIRAEESRLRASRKFFETDRKDGYFLHIIHSWTVADVWEYIHKNNLPYCKLYDEGFKRIGCVLCPCATKATTQRDLKRFPSIVQMYRDACNAAYQKGKDKGKKFYRWENGDGLFQWWLNCLLKIKTHEPNPYEITLFEENDKNEYLSL